MLGGTTFPPIGKGPYFLSLGPHGFYWFRLELQGDRPYGIERTAI
jgi:maltose alpha-D-glucosyltransferase/alpha-amylase